MSTVILMMRRTMSELRSRYATGLCLAVFLSSVAALFGWSLEAAEGGRAGIAVLWTRAVLPCLPWLAAFLAFDLWSGERRTGRLDLLLSVAVREHQLALGKFLGVWATLAFALLLSLAVALVSLLFLTSEAFIRRELMSFAPVFVLLALEGALWCALTLMVSACCRRASSSLCLSLALLVAVPRGLWAAAVAWVPSLRTAFGEMPLDALALDCANGLVSVGGVLTLVFLTQAVLFVTARIVCASRFVGRGARRHRLSTCIVCLLALATAFSAGAVFLRTGMRLDIPVRGEMSFSPRLRQVLVEAFGRISVTCFLPRSDGRFREVSRVLRALERMAEEVGGVELSVRYVDPRWDIPLAERLVRRGASEASVVFECGRRFLSVPLTAEWGEPEIVSALQCVVLPPQRRNVCWTVGHGESRIGDYGSWGASDIARELSREGYLNTELDLSADTPVPADAALVIVAGAKDDFSRAETARLDAYLRGGGRLLVLIGGSGRGGVSAMLPVWGVLPTAQPIQGARTLSGSDVLVSDFPDHPVSRSLRGSRVVLERPLSFAPSAAVAEGADRLTFAPLASVSGRAVAAAVERGAGAGSDLAIRPTRFVVIGDSTFALNEALAVRANANRDFFLNAVAYLSGTDAASASGVTSDVLVLTSGRSGRLKVLVAAVGLVPLLFLVLSWSVVAYGRRRS